MMNLQKIFALMGIHKFTSVSLRIVDCKPKHRGFSGGKKKKFFLLPSHFT